MIGTPAVSASDLTTDFDLLLLQSGLEDLADSRQGKLLRNPHPPWNGRAFGDVAGGEIEQFLLRDGNTGLGLDIGHRDLARIRIRAADGGGHGDRGVLVQSVLDQLRIDVVSASDDEFLASAREPEISVGILAAEITGIEPPLAIDIDPEVLIVRGSR